MGQLTNEELEQLLSQPMYAWDICTMLSGVVDYLEFSEDNLSWQKKRDIERAKSEGDNAIFEAKHQHLAGDYRLQLIEAAEYRFDVTLSQSVRYGGLTAFITTIELCAKTFEKSLINKYTKAPDGENEHAYLLSTLNNETNAGHQKEIENFKKLIYVRNCVVHAAGLMDKYAFKNQLIPVLESLNGFSVWSDNYLGASIHIEKGAIEQYAKDATRWVPNLHELCVNSGILKNNT